MAEDRKINTDPYLSTSLALLQGIVTDVLNNPAVPDEIRENRDHEVPTGHGFFPCFECGALNKLAVSMMPMPGRADKFMLMAMYVPAEFAAAIPVINPEDHN